MKNQERSVLIEIFFALLLWLLAHAFFAFDYFVKKIGSYLFVGFIIIDLAIIILLHSKDKNPNKPISRFLLGVIPIETLICSFILLYREIYTEVLMTVVMVPICIIIAIIIAFSIAGSRRTKNNNNVFNAEDSIENDVEKSSKDAKNITIISIVLEVVSLILIAIALTNSGNISEYFALLQVVFYLIALVLAIYVRVKNPSYALGKIWFRFLVMIMAISIEFYVCVLFFISNISCVNLI